MHCVAVKGRHLGETPYAIKVFPRNIFRIGGMYVYDVNVWQILLPGQRLIRLNEIRIVLGLGSPLGYTHSELNILDLREKNVSHIRYHLKSSWPNTFPFTIIPVPVLYFSTILKILFWLK